MSALIRFHAWEAEQALRLMYKQSNEVKYNIETFVLVIDASGWGLRLATSDAFTFIRCTFILLNKYIEYSSFVHQQNVSDVNILHITPLLICI